MTSFLAVALQSQHEEEEREKERERTYALYGWHFSPLSFSRGKRRKRKTPKTSSSARVGVQLQ